MNPILFLLLALTASWTGLVQCEDNEETEQEENAYKDPTLETSKVGEEENSENQGDGAGSGSGSGAGAGARDGRSQDLDSPPDIDSNTELTDTNEETKPTTEANTDADTDDLNPVMIVIPLVLTLVIIAVIVCVVMIYRRWSIKVGDTKGDPYLDHEDHENVPMPMFDDDIPSVMEMEMEDLENWMAKDGGKKVDTGQI